MKPRNRQRPTARAKPYLFLILTRLMSRLVFHLDDTFQKFAVALLQIANGRALVGGVLEVFLEELQPRAVLLDQLAPRLDADGDVVVAMDQLARGVGPALNVSLGEFVISV